MASANVTVPKDEAMLPIMEVIVAKWEVLTDEITNNNELLVQMGAFSHLNKVKLYNQLNNMIGTLKDFRIYIVEQRAHEHPKVKDIYEQLRKAIKHYGKKLFTIDIHSDGPQSQSVVDPPKANVKLPVINIPVFKGQIEGWPAFLNLFDATIHSNVNLQPVQKLQYLMSSLSDEPLNLIKHLQCISENYEVARKILNDKYMKHRQIVFNLIDNLLHLESITEPSSQGYYSLTSKVKETLLQLNNLGVQTHTWDPILVRLFTSKLDKQCRRHWSFELNNEDIPSIESVLDFVIKTADSMCEAAFVSHSNRSSKPVRKVFGTKKVENKSKSVYNVVSKVLKFPKCYFCKKPHKLISCVEFLKLSFPQRSEFLKKSKRCLKCFTSDHQAFNCRRANCSDCGRPHSNLVCFSRNKINSGSQQKPFANGNTQNVSSKKSTSSDNGVAGTTQKHGFHCATGSNSSIFGRGVILVEDADGSAIPVKVFIDNGSDVSLISNGLVKRLKLKTFNSAIKIKGIQGTDLAAVDKIVKLKFGSLTDSRFNLSSEFLVVDNLKFNLPSAPLQKQQFEFLNGLTLSDPDFIYPHPIEILVGVKLFAKLIISNLVKSPDDSIVAQNTFIGYVIFGEAKTQQGFCSHIDIKKNNRNDELNANLEKLWQMDVVSTPPTNEISLAEFQFVESIKQLPSGQLQVALPFKMDCKPLGDSFFKAKKMLSSLLRKLDRKPQMKEDYVRYFEDLQARGYIETVGTIDSHSCLENNTQFYLPHFPVFKRESSSMRVVLDGSSKSTSGYSLNDLLEVGDPLQNDIRIVLNRFRNYNVVVSTDIVKMYLQISINPEHRKYMKVLWQFPNDKMKIFQFTCVPFGLGPSAFLAIRSIKWLAEKHKLKFPLAFEAINSNTYLDDFLVGARNTSELEEVIMQICQVLKLGNFNLDKWSSNSPEIIEFLKKENILDSDSRYVRFGEETSILGIQWDSKSDLFYYKFSIIENRVLTKRSILSDLAKIYDPLGWISPCIIRFKIIFQEICKLKIDWDDLVPHNFQSRWDEFRMQVPMFNDFKLERNLIHPIANRYKMFCYADASEKSYGFVCYVVSYKGKEFLKSNLVLSKFKVVPLKVISLPRLELLATHLMIKMLNFLIPSFNFQIEFFHLFSDSTIVLSWINMPSYKFKTFVANRVQEIQGFKYPHMWSYVNTLENPADHGTRGMSILEFINLKNWKIGILSHYSQPLLPFQSKLDEEFLEKESKPLFAKVFALQVNPFLKDYIERFSNYNTLVRNVAILRKFICFLKQKFINKQICDSSSEQVNFISSSDIKVANLILIQFVQKESFSDEIKALKNGKNISRKSKLLSLAPFLDKDGISRAKGRLQNSELEASSKFPIILSKNSHFIRILVEYFHKKYLHCGPQNLSGILASKYWILRGRQLVRSVFRSCVICSRFNQKGFKPLLGNLPSERVTISRPFINVGLDFFGPFLVHYRLHRGSIPQKMYCLIFVCFSTKACHFELCNDLTTATFLQSLKRFIARRGVPMKIFSDNGTTFVAANRELRAELSLFNKNIISEQAKRYYSENEIQWSFIPPYSPNQGGLWEAGVKSAKNLLKKVIGKQLLTVLEFQTLICQVEAILNSRPLTPITSDIDDIGYLTPGHFLVGNALVDTPSSPDTVSSTDLPNRYKLQANMYQHFWSKWSSDYLHTLQQRYRLNIERKNLELGQLVIVHDRNLFPTQWLVGRVVRLHPGKDGVVRVATLKTRLGEIKRPVLKLTLLPTEATL